VAKKKTAQKLKAIFYPDVDFEKDDFMTKAHDVIDRYFGKPFVLSTVGKGQHVMHPVKDEE